MSNIDTAPADCGERAYGVEAACQQLDITKTTLYVLFRSGQLQARKLGSRTVVLRSEIDRYLAALPVAELDGEAP